MRNLLLSVLLCLATVAANAQCSVTASFSTTAASAPKTINLTNSSTVTNQPSNSIRQSLLRIASSPGLQTIANSGTISVTLPYCGNQTVTLITKVIDSNTQQVLCIDSTTQTINGLCPPCAVTFVKSIMSNGLVWFYASNPANTPGITYTWTFGDGTSGTGANISHTYLGSGNYTVKLVASASSVPCTDSVSETFYVSNSGCQSTITKYNGSNGTVNFNATTPSGSAGKTYTWDFGDGTSGTGKPITHVYAANGSYTVKLITQSTSCIDSTTIITVVTNKQGPCYTTITKSVSSIGVATFTATTAGGTGMSYNWNFGDGTSGTGSPVTHAYVTPGTYTVKLTASSSVNQCVDTAITTVTISTPPQNSISGMIIGDSTAADTFKVWLIQFDSASNNLYAVDSLITANGPTSYATYIFNNKPAGIYRTKAHQLNGPSSGTGFLPTYHTNSLYWNSASLIYHGAATTWWKDIYMQTGTVTSGPGFIGGNVTLGANKGTSNGIGGQLMFLRDNTEKVIAMVYTDNNGDYLFKDLPLGTYSIYPEDGGYTTTPATVTLTNLIKGTQNIHFEKHEVAQVITPKPTSVSQMAETHGFKVYPNPTSGLLYIDLGTTRGKSAVSISDITGKNVYKQELSGNGPQQSINISHLRAGQYFITIEAAGKQTTQKFVMEK